MTREEIENIPKNINTLLGLSVTMHTRQKLDEILNKVCELAIKTLEQEPKKGRWIPVSERLPKKRGHYMTTTVYGEVYCDYWNGETFERTEIVLAWMQKPEPYKGSEG